MQSNDVVLMYYVTYFISCNACCNDLSEYDKNAHHIIAISRTLTDDPDNNNID